MTEAGGGGIGFFGVLFIVLLILKLTGLIALSWFWVFACLWLPTVVILGLFGIGFLIYWGVSALRHGLK